MKTKIIALIAVVLCLTAFTIVIDKNSAIVEQQDNIYVFAFSKPTAKYDVLGMVKVSGMVSSEKAPHMVELLVKRCKKDYPSGEAIIINSDFEKAEVIKFKE